MAAQNNENQMNGTAEELSRGAVGVVMVPLPAQGHLNQLLHLSRLISAHNIPVHFVSSTTHSRQAKTRLHGWDPTAATNIKFHEFPTPTFSNPPPDPNSAIKFPSQILPSLKASSQLRQPVHHLVQELSATVGRIVVIYDSLMAYVVQDVCSISNVESYCFQSVSAFAVYSFFWELTGPKTEQLPTGAEIIGDVPSVEGCFPPEFWEWSETHSDKLNLNSGDILNTSRVIDGFFIDVLAKGKCTGTENIWALGPFNPVFLPSGNHSESRHKCLEWLDKQSPDSVIFVSFGTTSSFSHEQITELALGLERSQHKFIWVLRDADKGNIFEGETRKTKLPENYEERLLQEERGLIIRDWAPQLEILHHPSTGGFVSHCGWNSTLESISMGVPIATWPMHSDQPKNAVMITKFLRIGIEMKDWSRRDEGVAASRVEEIVRRLMVGEDGSEIRKRVKELGDHVRKGWMDGGVTRKEMDSFISHISRPSL